MSDNDHDENEDEPLTEPSRKKLRQKWNDLREWRTLLRSVPDRQPVIKRPIRPTGSSGLFVYRLSALDYEQAAARWFPDRNKTFRRNFTDYVSQLFSILIESELHPDETLIAEPDGKEIHSWDLKKISRNYADHNEELVRRGFLNVLGLHENRKKKKICRK